MNVEISRRTWLKLCAVGLASSLTCKNDQVPTTNTIIDSQIGSLDTEVISPGDSQGTSSRMQEAPKDPEAAIPISSEIDTPTIPETPKTTSLNDYLKPIILRISKERHQRAKTDPFFHQSINLELNQSRINLLLFSWGITHEPPLAEKDVIGSHTIFSLNYLRNIIDKISWTHDIRCPEVEKRLIETDLFRGRAEKIDQAYLIGGFNLQREVVQAATGLNVDLQMAFPDEIIVELINCVYKNLLVDNPKRFTAHPIYYQDKKFPEHQFDEGIQLMDGLLVLQYIKAIPKDDPDKVLEHNRRKYRVLNALKSKTAGISYYLKLVNFLKDKINDKTIQTDFDINNYLFSLENLTTILGLGSTILTGNSLEEVLPKNGREIYIVDWAHGDGGVQWVNANAAVNYITRQDISLGLYGTALSYEVPFHTNSPVLANPYSDNLIADYWTPMRVRIQEMLS